MVVINVALQVGLGQEALITLHALERQLIADGHQLVLILVEVHLKVQTKRPFNF